MPTTVRVDAESADDTSANAETSDVVCIRVTTRRTRDGCGSFAGISPDGAAARGAAAPSARDTAVRAAPEVSGVALQ
jgi:hypothetical protein